MGRRADLPSGRSAGSGHLGLCSTLSAVLLLVCLFLSAGRSAEAATWTSAVVDGWSCSEGRTLSAAGLLGYINSDNGDAVSAGVCYADKAYGISDLKHFSVYFTNTFPALVASIDSVHIIIDHQGVPGKTGAMIVHLSTNRTASSWYTGGTGNSQLDSGDVVWTELEQRHVFDATAFLDTPEKINNCEVLLLDKMLPSHKVYFDYARLEVRYTPMTPPVVANEAGASGISAVAATLNGALTSTGGGATEVRLYWGTVDGGTNVGNWATNRSLGVLGTGPFSSRVEGLVPAQQYSYRCRALNAAGEVWAPASSLFTTPSHSLEFIVPASTHSETVTPAFVALALTPVSAADVTVDYAVGGGNAETPADYVLPAGTLTFAGGTTNGTLQIVINDDPFYETNETFVITLTDPVNSALGAVTEHVVTIADDDKGLPGVDNDGGAMNISASAATLRTRLFETGNESPTLFVCWGPADAGTDLWAWPNVAELGVVGQGTYLTNVVGLVSNTLYYYRSCASNSVGAVWSPDAESFLADNPPQAQLTVNGGMETQAADGSNADAANWTRQDEQLLGRVALYARTGSYSMKYEKNHDGTYIYGSQSNAFRVSWNGQFADGGLHPAGGLRPGVVLAGSAYTRAKASGKDAAQFRFRWRCVDSGLSWMNGSLSHNSTTYQQISVGNPNPVPATDTGLRYRPELIRVTGDTAAATDFHGDDLSVVAFAPRMELEVAPSSTVMFPLTSVGASSETELGVRNIGASGTVLHGAYITEAADLTNAAWAQTAWVVCEDPNNAFSVANGASLAAAGGAGWQYGTIRFSPPASGTFTGTVRVATTDPIDRYSGGGTIQSSIVYEEYTLVGTGVSTYEIVATAGANGSITPADTVGIAQGGTTNFVITPDANHHIDDVLVNGVSVGPTNVYTFSSVDANHTIDAAFAANLVTNDVPAWWLAAYGLGTNDAAALADADGDGSPNWHEYYAGTNPTNAASVLQIESVAASAGTELTVTWASVAGKVYTVSECPDLAAGSWTPLATNITATAPLNSIPLDVSGMSAGFFRIELK